MSKKKTSSRAHTRAVLQEHLTLREAQLEEALARGDAAEARLAELHRNLVKEQEKVRDLEAKSERRGKFLTIIGQLVSLAIDPAKGKLVGLPLGLIMAGMGLGVMAILGRSLGA